jgi:hypothetical protein
MRLMSIPTHVLRGEGRRIPQYNDHSPIEEAHMRQHSTLARVTDIPKRVAAATATIVAMIATVGAPFKWSVLFTLWK